MNIQKQQQRNVNGSNTHPSSRNVTDNNTEFS